MNQKTHINIILPPAQSQDNPANLFMFMCFFPESKSVVHTAGGALGATPDKTRLLLRRRMTTVLDGPSAFRGRTSGAHKKSLNA